MAASQLNYSTSLLFSACKGSRVHAPLSPTTVSNVVSIKIAILLTQAISTVA